MGKTTLKSDNGAQYILNEDMTVTPVLVIDDEVFGGEFRLYEALRKVGVDHYAEEKPVLTSDIIFRGEGDVTLFALDFRSINTKGLTRNNKEKAKDLFARAIKFAYPHIEVEVK